MLTEGYFQCIFAINLRKNCTVHRLVSLKSYLKRNLKKKKLHILKQKSMFAFL